MHRVNTNQMRFQFHLLKHWKWTINIGVQLKIEEKHSSTEHLPGMDMCDALAKKKKKKKYSRSFTKPFSDELSVNNQVTHFVDNVNC